MAGDIEFLDAEPPPGEDEQLPQAPRRNLPGTPRGRRIAGVVAIGVLIVGAVVVRAATGSGSDDRAAPSPSLSDPVTAAPSVAPPVRGLCTVGVPAAVVTPDPSGAASVQEPGTDSGPRAQGSRATGSAGGSDTCDPSDPAYCPQATDGQNACTTTGEVPFDVVQAVQQRYPGARYVSAATEIVRETHRVWYRSVILRQGVAVSIHVVVEQSGHDAGESNDTDNGSTDVVRVVHRGTDVTTVVAVTSPSGTRPDLNRALALVGDPRLVAVG